MTVSLSLGLTGTDDEPRWITEVTIRRMSQSFCCQSGHGTPEEAATHGAALAAIRLSTYARSLAAPACGALAIQKLEAAA